MKRAKTKEFVAKFANFGKQTKMFRGGGGLRQALVPWTRMNRCRTKSGSFVIELRKRSPESAKSFTFTAALNLIPLTSFI